MHKGGDASVEWAFHRGAAIKLASIQPQDQTAESGFPTEAGADSVGLIASVVS